MFSESDLNLLRAWRQQNDTPVELTIRTTPAPQSEKIRAFSDALSKALPKLTVRRRPADIDTDPPALVISPRLHYLAVPTGPELSPFLAVLRPNGAGLPPLTDAIQGQLSALPLAAHLEVFIAPRCPYCPAAVKEMLRLARASGPHRVSVIDGELFPDLAATRDIRTAPTVVLDGGFRWAGTVQVGEVVDVMANREPSRLGPDTLRGIIEDGMAATVAQMMADHGDLFDNLLPLLTHEKWPIRLGAMVVMEHFQTLRPNLAAATMEKLWPLFHAAPEAVKGDLLHVIGETGDERHVDRLAALTGPDATGDIAEAAADALAAIHQRRSTKR
jgi:thiol-disulfide isomerase/thioredoxin